MQFKGRYRIGAPRRNVWSALNDAGVLMRTIPGCTRIDWVTDATLEIEITIDFGVVKPRFTGGLELTNVVPAESYTLSGRGKGGLLGLAHGAADIELSDDGEDCILGFTATGGASNALMKLGRAVIGKSAQWVIDRFFERFAEAMGAPLEVLPPADEGERSPGVDPA